MYARTVTLLARGVTAQHSALAASHLPFAAPAVAVSHRFLHATPVCERKRTGKYEKRIKTAAAKAKASALLDTQDAAQATRRNLLNSLAAEGVGVADGTTDTPAGGPKLVYGFTDEMVATCDPEVQKVFALENADKEEINRLRVMNAMRAMQRFEGDTGSPEVQIAGLTARIRILVEHLSEHHKDNHSRFGLNKLVQRRRNLLMYLRSTDLPKYATTLTALGLRPIKTVRNSHSQ